MAINFKLGKRAQVLGWLLVTLLVILFLIFSYFLFNNLRTANRIFSGEQRYFFDILLQHRKAKQVTVSDVDHIDSWMTFQYVNVIFKLPDNYLKDALKISDSHYPNMTLRRYARNAGIIEPEFVTALKQAVRQFLTPPASR